MTSVGRLTLTSFLVLGSAFGETSLVSRVVLLRGGRYRHLRRFLLDLPRLIASDAILLLLILNLKLLYLRE